ncbi:MAG: DUF1476 domain-containing protein [Pseudomonadota bacterium]
MSQFDDRQKGQEAKYAMDQQTEFKVMARRNKLLGLWAADLLGLTDEEATAYAKTVVMADLEEPGDEDVFRKVRGDLDGKAVNVTDAQIREHMAELLPVARDQVVKDAG